MMHTRRSKAARRLWWTSLSPEEKEGYIKKKQAQKAEARARFGYVKQVTGFEKTGVNSANRQQWQDLILSMNPWLSEEVFCS